MSDRIGKILKTQIKVDKRYLKYLQEGGLAFPDLAGVIPKNQAELIVRISNLENALARHETRNA